MGAGAPDVEALPTRVRRTWLYELYIVDRVANADCRGVCPTSA